MKGIPKSRAKTAYGLLNEIKRLIMEEPKRYNQSRYIARVGGEGGADPDAPNGFPSCGTVGCVAGWVATLKVPRPFRYQETEDLARGILGLTGDQSYQLFAVGAVTKWDRSYNPYTDVGVAPQTKAYARLGVKHITAFQKDYAAQLKATRV